MTATEACDFEFAYIENPKNDDIHVHHVLIMEGEDDYAITLNKKEVKRIPLVMQNVTDDCISIHSSEMYKQNGMGGVVNESVLPRHRELMDFVLKAKVSTDDILSVRKDELHRLAVVKDDGYFAKRLTVLPDIQYMFKPFTPKE